MTPIGLFFASSLIVIAFIVIKPKYLTKTLRILRIRIDYICFMNKQIYNRHGNLCIDWYFLTLPRMLNYLAHLMVNHTFISKKISILYREITFQGLAWSSFGDPFIASYILICNGDYVDNNKYCNYRCSIRSWMDSLPLNFWFYNFDRLPA